MEYVTYRIKDPRDNVPVYVGQTQDFDKRKKGHLRDAKKPLPKTKTIGIKMYLVLLYKDGIEPEFEVVDSQKTKEDSLKSEIRWVKRTVEQGFPVLNRWKTHREITKSRFTSAELKKYFYSRLPNK